MPHISNRYFAITTRMEQGSVPRSIPSYEDLRTIEGLFAQARLDESRTCVIWNENIDLPSDTLYEYGRAMA